MSRACCPNGTERGSATRSSPECRTGAGNSMGFRTVERAAAHRAALRRHRNRFEQHALKVRPLVRQMRRLHNPTRRRESALISHPQLLGAAKRSGDGSTLNHPQPFPQPFANHNSGRRTVCIWYSGGWKTIKWWPERPFSRSINPDFPFSSRPLMGVFMAKPLINKDFACPKNRSKKVKKMLTSPYCFETLSLHTVTTEQKTGNI